MNILNTKAAILSTIMDKASLKQVVYKNTKEIFEELRTVVKNLIEEYNSELGEVDEIYFFLLRTKENLNIKLRLHPIF